MYHANEFQYIEIVFEVCPLFGEKEGIECAPLPEISDYLDGLPIQVITFKPNFKLGKSLESNFALQTKIGDRPFFKLNTYTHQKVNIFIRETRLKQSGTGSSLYSDYSTLLEIEEMEYRDEKIDFNITNPDGT